MNKLYIFKLLVCFLLMMPRTFCADLDIKKYIPVQKSSTDWHKLMSEEITLVNGIHNNNLMCGSICKIRQCNVFAVLDNKCFIGDALNDLNVIGDQTVDLNVFYEEGTIIKNEDLVLG